jgi:hypothetical protein
MACLSKAAKDRPESAAELARSLAAIDGEHWTQAQAKEWWRVNPPEREEGRNSDFSSAESSDG